MSLIKSISGIRGTIGGPVGDNLTPVDITRFVAAYCTQRRAAKPNVKNMNTIVVGRDARISGPVVDVLVTGTLQAMGYDVVNIGLASTPTTELAVTMEEAAGGIILTASHNPKQWNALKLLNEKGEFLNDAEGKGVLKIAEDEDFHFAEVDNLGAVVYKNDYTQKHIEKVLSLKLVDVEDIKKAHLTVAVDAVNSVGGIAIPALLEQLGVEKVVKLNCEPTGRFAHNPEPLPAHLTELSDLIKKGGIDLGVVVDPDVDRLALIQETGEMFGEEYTLVSVADYVLSHTPGNTCSNMSSTRALRDVTRKHGGEYTASAVGEVNVVTEMKRVGAVIGGEGNGGVIYPECHYGRDALVGVALFLTRLAQKKAENPNYKVSDWKKELPEYFISKNRIDLKPGMDVDTLLVAIKGIYKMYEVNDKDGVKIDFPQGWVHLRKSNTEPIMRVYSEAPTMEQADKFAQATIAEVKRLAGIS